MSKILEMVLRHLEKGLNNDINDVMDNSIYVSYGNDIKEQITKYNDMCIEYNACINQIERFKFYFKLRRKLNYISAITRDAVLQKIQRM